MPLKSTRYSNMPRIRDRDCEPYTVRHAVARITYKGSEKNSGKPKIIQTEYRHYFNKRGCHIAQQWAFRSYKAL